MSSSSQEIRQMQPVEVRVSRSTSSEKRGGRNCTHDHVPTSQIINNNNNNNIVPNCSSSSLTKKVKVVVIRYMECMKNHAASIGGNARDGCGEFMATTTTTTTTTTTGEQEEEEGEYALNCSACNCHRNFHRKLEILVHHHHQNNNKDIYIGDGGVVLLGQELIGYPTTTTTTTATTMGDNHNHHLSKENEEEEEGTGLMLFGGIKVDQLIEDVKRTTRPPPTNCKKRFRTKFSQEQKEKMLSFADKAGWKIQKLGDSVVNQFCQEIGIKRRVLKVWMHNNKHHHHHHHHHYISSTTST